jgi:hypothetical protein
MIIKKNGKRMDTNCIHSQPVPCGLRLGVIDKSITPKEVNASVEQGELFVFGYNEEGQLGLGHYDNQNKPIKLMSDVTLLQNSVNFDSEW